MSKLRDGLTYEPKELTFGTSGLRALVTDMTDLECYLNTVGFLRFLAQAGLIAAQDTVYVAGDLRDSTPRITRAVTQAVLDGGYQIEYDGLIPTPALALRALECGGAGIMVTGSHIPADRNGIKFYKPAGEVLKDDEVGIKSAVAAVRNELYEADMDTSAFTSDGSLKQVPALPEVAPEARAAYLRRYTEAFGSERLAGKTVVFYQHSAVGRDDLTELFESLGAKVVPVGRSETFIPIDSENVTAENRRYFKELVEQHPGLFAIASTDGDSDRPFVIDERGVFHRGDVLGAVVAQWLQADFAAYPVSSSDALDTWLDEQGVARAHTKIGSPYVIAAMDEAREAGKQVVVGWEVNGGFLTGSDVQVYGHTLRPLPTRDAALPIIVALVRAAEAGMAVSDIFTALPQRATQAGLIDNFPVEVARAMVKQGKELAKYFGPDQGFGALKEIDALDGVRMYFDNGDIAHLRPSGNAPQLRIYSVANSQERANEIVELALAEPDGIFRTIQRSL
jgi:phosphomannomutase